MKFRTCPECGYKYSSNEYFKLRLSNVFKLSWNCKRCNVEIKTNVRTRFVVTVIFLALISVLTYYIAMSYPNFKFIAGLTPIVVILFTYILYACDVLVRKRI